LNDLIFTNASISWHTYMGTVTDANSHTPVPLFAVVTADDDAQTSCTNLNTPNSTLDEDNGFAYFQNTSNTTAVTFTFSGSQTSGVCTTSPSGVGGYSAVAMAFK
jgi:hypothetical protein